MSRIVTVAATQMACSWDLEANLETAERLVREAAAKGAQIILIQELFEAPYFCQKPNPDYLQLATTVDDNVAIKHFQKVAKELQVSTSGPGVRASTASRSSMPTAATSGFIGKAIFRTAPAITRSTTSTRATRVSKCGIPVTQKSVWVSAGTSGSRNARAAWRCRARRS